jgi:hypothetical protein
MGLTYSYMAGEEPGEMSEIVIIDRHLYLTEDRSRVVEEGDPASRWLWASPGQEVPREEAERLGAVKPAESSAESSAEPAEPVAEPAEPKQRKPPANKQRAKPEDK